LKTLHEKQDMMTSMHIFHGECVAILGYI